MFLEVNYNAMRPLDEYMLFTKTGSEKVNVTNSQGIRSAQCASFDDLNKPGPTLNISYVSSFIFFIIIFKLFKNKYFILGSRTNLDSRSSSSYAL